MKSICIKTNNRKVINYLLNNLKTINCESIFYSCHKFKIFNNIFIHYNGTNINSFLNFISNLLTSLIINIYEPDFLINILEKEYFYFEKKEEKIILDKIYKNNLNDIENYTIKKDIIFSIFFNYFKKNKSIYLKGFITFRLKNYFNILEDYLESAVNQYVIEKEYNEFVKLLRLYINSESKNKKSVHLIYKKENTILLDEKKNIIETKINTFNTKYLSDINFSSADKILNTLLNILPKRIYIHLSDKDEDDFINTLKLIFEKRIVILNENENNNNKTSN